MRVSVDVLEIVEQRGSDESGDEDEGRRKKEEGEKVEEKLESYGNLPQVVVIQGQIPSCLGPRKKRTMRKRWIARLNYRRMLR